MDIGNLQLNVIVLINRMARLLKGNLKANFIKMMNNHDNKAVIYAYCMENSPETLHDKALAKALNIYQTIAIR